MIDPLQMTGHSQIFPTHQSYVVWSHRPPPYPRENPAVFSRLPAFNSQLPPVNHPGRVNWKGNKLEKRSEFRRGDLLGSGLGSWFTNQSDSQPSTANRSGRKARRFHHHKRKFTGDGRLAVPFAPRNTTSFIIRAKKSGGIASLVSPCPVTPAILPTPTLSPSTEVVVEMAKEEWGVDGYGSMKGLIRLRSEKEDSDSDEIDGDDGGGGGDHVEVEKRLDHDLSRFEMIHPSSGDENSLENRVDEQDTQIAHLEEENLTLKERIFLMERELGELRRRVICLETDGIGGGGGGREPENFHDDLTGDVCSEKSVGNGYGHAGV